MSPPPLYSAWTMTRLVLDGYVAAVVLIVVAAYVLAPLRVLFFARGFRFGVGNTGMVTDLGSVGRRRPVWFALPALRPKHSVSAYLETRVSPPSASVPAASPPALTLTPTTSAHATVPDPVGAPVNFIRPVASFDRGASARPTLYAAIGTVTRASRRDRPVTRAMSADSPRANRLAVPTAGGSSTNEGDGSDQSQGGRVSPSSVALSISTGSSFRYTAATKNAECPICFGPLYREWTSVGVDLHGRRTCNHFYHERCLKTLYARECTLCHARFDYRRRVPNLEESPAEWFEVVDSDGSGALERSELVDCLRAQINVDLAVLEAVLAKEWRRWDPDGSGSISLMEFFQPRTGLLAYLKKRRSKLRLAVSKREAPDIRDDLSAWFDYWDLDHNHTLDKDEVVRALIKSFGLTNHAKVALRLHRVLDAIWPVFDKDSSGAIDRDEFLHPKDGLGAAIVASLEM